MSLLYRLGLGVGLFAAGFLLHAWSPWTKGVPTVRPGSPLAVMDYESYVKVVSDPELEQEAARFLVGLDRNYPGTATELMLGIVMLHQQYGEPHLFGYQISSYADRYGDAQALLTSHLLKDAPAQHRDRYLRLRAILNELNQREGDYVCVFGGTGCWRDRRMEHLEVEDMLSRWALRLAHEPGSTNLSPLRSFSKLQHRLSADKEFVDKEFETDRDDRDFFQKQLVIPRGHVITAFNRLIEELKAWPPEVADELSPLILRTFQE
jgi:hypothetical protein